jgi:hypothetical protein
MSAAGRIAIFGEHDAKTIAQLEDVASRAERAALAAAGSTKVRTHIAACRRFSQLKRARSKYSTHSGRSSW